ncbi:Otopetrin-2, partial [Stegodyphus mimosarum]
MASQDIELTIGDEQKNLFTVEPHRAGLVYNGTDANDIEDKHGTNSEGTKTDGTLHALSALYAQIIVVVAAILVFTELLHGPVPLFFFHGYLFTYLVGGAILCFIGAYVNMLTSKLPRWANKNYDGRNEKSLFSTHFMKNLFFADISIYLRIGSVVFGLGTLISSGLEVASVFTVPSECMDELNLLQPVLRGLFSFLQMHFLFMNTKDMVNSFRWFRHTALMHLVATNLAIWIRIMLWESARDWLDAIHYKHNSSTEWYQASFNISMHTLESDTNSLDTAKHKPYHRIYG